MLFTSHTTNDACRHGLVPTKQGMVMDSIETIFHDLVHEVPHSLDVMRVISNEGDF